MIIGPPSLRFRDIAVYVATNLHAAVCDCARSMARSIHVIKSCLERWEREQSCSCSACLSFSSGW